ncbi:MAG TPA: flagellar biosynthetic protein FliR, partial [Pseudomonadales bacterium]|nr:flagellar biosynthetic protein FliR [Pseudomonadales bacterium]
MLTLSAAAIEKELLGLLLPLFRISAFYLAVPIIGSNLVPRRVRMGLALATTLVVLPTLPAMPALQAFSL